MKKALYILLTICSVFLLVGCTSQNEREEVIDNFQKKANIKIKGDLIDIVENISGGWAFHTWAYDYVYKTNDGNYLLRIYNDKKSEDNSTTYKIEYSKIATTEDLVEIPASEKDSFTARYKYIDGKLFKNNKYIVDVDTTKKYELTKTKKKILIFTRYSWSIKEIKEDSN